MLLSPNNEFIFWGFRQSPYVFQENLCRQRSQSRWVIYNYTSVFITYIEDKLGTERKAYLSSSSYFFVIYIQAGKVKIVRPFLKCQSETLTFHPLTLNQFANVFLHRSLCFFFHLKNMGSGTLHTPSHFPFFGPSLSDVGANLLVSFSKVCK